MYSDEGELMAMTPLFDLVCHRAQTRPVINLGQENQHVMNAEGVGSHSTPFVTGQVDASLRLHLGR